LIGISDGDQITRDLPMALRRQLELIDDDDKGDTTKQPGDCLFSIVIRPFVSIRFFVGKSIFVILESRSGIVKGETEIALNIDDRASDSTRTANYRTSSLGFGFVEEEKKTFDVQQQPTYSNRPDIAHSSDRTDSLTDKPSPGSRYTSNSRITSYMQPIRPIQVTHGRQPCTGKPLLSSSVCTRSNCAS
jgi:hypothetical protein